MLGVLFAGLLALPAAAADQPLSADDITSLLLGGSATQKIVRLVEHRGLSFKMSPDLAKKFHDDGASNDLVEALTKAGLKGKDTSSTLAASASAPDPSQPTQSTNASAPDAEPAHEDQKAGATLSSPDSNSADEDYPYAPQFSLVSLSGEKIDLANYRGKVVILSFWASWCPYCRKLIPMLVEFQRQYYDQGLRVIGIAVQDEPDAVRTYYHLTKMNYPVAMEDARTEDLYAGMQGVPNTLMIGRDGRIYFSFGGTPSDPLPVELRIKVLLNFSPEGSKGNQSR
jgi:thiol-disulfide isomerase/thioredoxin